MANGVSKNEEVKKDDEPEPACQMARLTDGPLLNLRVMKKLSQLI